MLCCIFFLPKMKKTDTNDIEQSLINMFKESENEIEKEKVVKANYMINRLLEAFRFISIFDKINHVEIITQLYFTKCNIKELGIRKMADKLFMDEKTLYKLRRKYCEVAKIIMKEE